MNKLKNELVAASLLDSNLFSNIQKRFFITQNAIMAFFGVLLTLASIKMGSTALNFCGECPPIQVATEICANIWVPQYEQSNAGADFCLCPKKYVCCPSKCPEVKDSLCAKGTTISATGKDVCGCPMMGCVKCPAPKTEGEMSCGKCFDYALVPNDANGCLQATCKRKDPPEFPAKNCSVCEREVIEADDCGFKRTTCRKEPCVFQPAPKCCGSQVLNVRSDSCGCQEFFCGCERECPSVIEPVCDDSSVIHDNWCQFGIEACKMEKNLRILKIAPLTSCPQSPGPNHCFTFDEIDPLAHVVLHPLLDEPISDFTVDLTYQFSKLTSHPHLISYAVPGRYNEFLISLKNVWLGNSQVQSYPLQGKELQVFYRFTLTLKNSKMLLYWDQELISEKRVKEHALQMGGTWILGQDQDALGGKFEAGQRFIGKICNFRMWKFGLNKNEIGQFFKSFNKTDVGSVFDNPPSYRYEAKNGAY